MTQNSVNAKNSLIQYKYNVLTSAVTVNSAIPKDNSVPQKTEGVEAMTCTITPTSSTNLLVIKAFVWGFNSAGNADIVMALFQDATSNALAAIEGIYVSLAGWTNRCALYYQMVAGTTSSTTFKIRCGQNTAHDIYINPGIYGGVETSYMEIMEIKA